MKNMPPAKSHNVHRKVTVHTESLPGQWLGKEIRMLQVRRHMLNLKLFPSYTLPNEVVADVDVLGLWGGSTRVVGHAKGTHVILLHQRSAKAEILACR